MMRIKRRTMIALALFAVLLAQGATLGMSDDEAYYWVLAHHPALGYAFHPPAVAWAIAAAQLAFGWLGGPARAWIVRLPACAGVAFVLWLALGWLARAGAPDERPGRAAATLLSFAGLFALGWMMVPDVPLFVGWMIAFGATWDLCFGSRERPRDYAALAGGAALALLSKYSAVLAAPSAALCLIAAAPRERRARGLVALFAGGILAAAPILVWNARHDWASILYQIRDRHGAPELSFHRYARFWLIELAAAGPVLVAFGLGLLTRARLRDLRAGQGGARVFSFCAIWAVPPALVFGLQPLFFGDFKPHWIFIAWWPAALALAYAAMTGAFSKRAINVQIAYGCTLGALAFAVCQLPILSWAQGGHDPHRDPKMDPSNDLRGWDELPAWLASQGAPAWPVVGSRYQTASQAAFALGDAARVTLLPRDLKARDEWPELGVSDGIGPDWPRLTAPVLFVADNRYDAGPDFRGADCRKLGRLEAERGGMTAKWIYVWACQPAAARP